MFSASRNALQVHGTLIQPWDGGRWPSSPEHLPPAGKKARTPRRPPLLLPGVESCQSSGRDTIPGRMGVHLR